MEGGEQPKQEGWRGLAGIAHVMQAWRRARAGVLFKRGTGLVYEQP
jgi:hypothetical protein